MLQVDHPRMIGHLLLYLGVAALGSHPYRAEGFVFAPSLRPPPDCDSGHCDDCKTRARSPVPTMSASQTVLQVDQGIGPRAGILIVGLGGANGVTTVAGIIANKESISWEGPTGRMTPNYLGCITQLPSKGGNGGYRERYLLADANDAAIGGWDIRPTPLGEALYNARILDFDLVRQVKTKMDALKVLPGVWDPDFIGESQHASATNVVGDGQSQQSRLELLRRDIREFRELEGVTGHVTVIWSASVERPSEREFGEPKEVRLHAAVSGASEIDTHEFMIA